MYPILVKEISRALRQPLYSNFIFTLNNIDYPITVNETGEQIFLLCNGKNDVNSIKRILSEMYSEEFNIVSELVDDFIKNAIQYGHIVPLEDKSTEYRSVKLCGSKEYWTPDILVLELTTACPLDCRHCYVDKSSPAVMEKHLVNDIISQMLALNIYQVQLTGGEPFSHPNIKEIIRAFSDANIFMFIFTSGYISNEVTDFLLTFSPEKMHFQVSLDGLEEYHDSFRNKKGAFMRTADFIKKLTSAGHKVNVGTCISTQTEKELEELCDFCIDSGVSVIRIATIVEHGEAANNGIQRTDDQTAWVLNIQQKLAASKNSENFKVLLVESELKPNMYRKNCGTGQALLKVAPDGKVAPCNISDTVIGNIYKESISSILTKKSRLFEQLDMPDKALCQDCEYEPLCHHCIIEGLLYSQKANICYWKEHNQELLSLIIE